MPGVITDLIFFTELLKPIVRVCVGYLNITVKDVYHGLGITHTTMLQWRQTLLIWIK